MRRVLLRVGAVLLPRRVGLLKLPQQLAEFFLPLLRVAQFRGQRLRRALTPDRVLAGVGLGSFLEQRPELRLQFRQHRSDLFGGPGVMPTGVGLYPRAVDGHLQERQQPHRHRHLVDLAEQGLELLGKAGAELADRVVVDGAAFGQPEEVEVVDAGVLQLPTGADASHQPVEDYPRHDPRRDRRLSMTPVVMLRPRRPVVVSQDFLQQADGMLLADALIQRRAEQQGLLPIQSWLRPILHAQPLHVLATSV